MWSRLNDGERVRWLKAHQYELHLSRDQFLQLGRVPFWAVYGPEHGLPPELFNDRGYLLPKYRPGGGLHAEFQQWRRAYRHVTWHRLLLWRRVQRFFRGNGQFLVAGWLMAAVVLGHLLARTLRDRFAGVHREVLTWAIIVGLLLVSGMVFLLATVVVSRCISRAALRHLAARRDTAAPPQATAGPVALGPPGVFWSR